MTVVYLYISIRLVMSDGAELRAVFYFISSFPFPSWVWCWRPRFWVLRARRRLEACSLEWVAFHYYYYYYYVFIYIKSCQIQQALLSSRAYGHVSTLCHSYPSLGKDRAQLAKKCRWWAISWRLPARQSCPGPDGFQLGKLPQPGWFFGCAYLLGLPFYPRGGGRCWWCRCN